MNRSLLVRRLLRVLDLDEMLLSDVMIVCNVDGADSWMDAIRGLGDYGRRV